MQRKYQWTDRKPGSTPRHKDRANSGTRDDRGERDEREHVLDNGIASVEQYTR